MMSPEEKYWASIANQRAFDAESAAVMVGHRLAHLEKLLFEKGVVTPDELIVPELPLTDPDPDRKWFRNDDPEITCTDIPGPCTNPECKGWAERTDK